MTLNPIDWLVLAGTLIAIVAYGVWKGRQARTMKEYLLANKDMRWHTVAISIMATQASAITFLSGPGQAYAEGMGFVQIYLGLPIAMVILSIVALPRYHKLNVYTAYEYLEQRFDMKTRGLAAFFFLIQRGLAAGITIFAPAIVLSLILDLNIHVTIVVTGALVIIYTASGGSRAVNWTQFQQMLIVFFGMVATFFLVVKGLPEELTFGEAVAVAGKFGRLEALDLEFDFTQKYNIWSGILGGLFLSLSYFGTDQSQVQRYLTGKSVAASRTALLFNGLIKIPMQFCILFLGTMVFVFYLFVQPPVFFKQDDIKRVGLFKSYQDIEQRHEEAFEDRRKKVWDFVYAHRQRDEAELDRTTTALKEAEENFQQVRTDAIAVIQGENKESPDDTNYVFLSFVLNFLPVGLIGLVLAGVFSAAMSSTASEINALGSTMVVDIYKRMMRPNLPDEHYVAASKLFTLGWGVLAIGFAEIFNLVGSLIEVVNVLGSLFYGTILGIFLVAFFLKRVGGTATFLAALVTEGIIFYIHYTGSVPFLWYNPIGCLLTMGFALAIQLYLDKKKGRVEPVP